MPDDNIYVVNHAQYESKIDLLNGKIQQYTMPFKQSEGDQFFNDAQQAHRIFNDLLAIIEKKIALGVTPKVAITYAANTEQAKEIIEAYTSGNHFSIDGGGQAGVFKILAAKIQEAGLQNYIHILPIATMTPDGKTIEEETLNTNLANVSKHLGAGYTVLALRNQLTNPKSFVAVGGNIAQGVWSGSNLEKKCQAYFEAWTTVFPEDKNPDTIKKFDEILKRGWNVVTEGSDVADTNLQSYQTFHAAELHAYDEGITNPKDSLEIAGKNYDIPDELKKKINQARKANVTPKTPKVTTTTNLFTSLNAKKGQKDLNNVLKNFNLQFESSTPTDASAKESAATPTKNIIGYIYKQEVVKPTGEEEEAPSQLHTEKEKILTITQNSLELCKNSTDKAEINLQVTAMISVLSNAINSAHPPINAHNPLTITPNDAFTQECFTALIAALQENNLPVKFTFQESHKFNQAMQEHNNNRNPPKTKVASP